jgi:hypothetical protein
VPEARSGCDVHSPSRDSGRFSGDGLPRQVSRFVVDRRSERVLRTMAIVREPTASVGTAGGLFLIGFRDSARELSS